MLLLPRSLERELSSLNLEIGWFRDKDIGEHPFLLFIAINAELFLFLRKICLFCFLRRLSLAMGILLRQIKNLLMQNVPNARALQGERQILWILFLIALGIILDIVTLRIKKLHLRRAKLNIGCRLIFIQAEQSMPACI